MMQDPHRMHRLGARDDAIGAATITGIVVGSLLVAAGIVWALDSHVERFTNDTTTPSTVGQGSSRIDQGFSQIESAPAPATAPAIKFEPSSTEATKIYTLPEKQE
jgi:hypothetical protein